MAAAGRVLSFGAALSVAVSLLWLERSLFVVFALKGMETDGQRLPRRVRSRSAGAGAVGAPGLDT